ncbi:MAG TPA: hypothetical protein PLD92_08600, partial [Candidatus Omnitrophota bacterium]|nr:hypothetical protein [Candidatus Omnitrophota bacterium]
ETAGQALSSAPLFRFIRPVIPEHRACYAGSRLCPYISIVNKKRNFAHNANITTIIKALCLIQKK